MTLDHQQVFVTGATGFIGGHLVRRLLDGTAAHLRALVRDPARAAALARRGVELVHGDLADSTLLRQALRGCSVVIHAAAQVASVRDRRTFQESNRLGTSNLLHAAREAGVGHFVHLSSVAVFGLPAAGEITDESPRGYCGEAYCDTKFDAEEAVRRYNRERGLPAVILRPSCVYGPGSTHWSVIPLKRLRKGKLFVVNGGRGTLNYVYIDNLVDAILLAAEDDRALGRAFIVNDGVATWRDFFGYYARMLGQGEIRSVPLWLAKIALCGRNLGKLLAGQTTRVPLATLSFFTGTPVYRQTDLEQTLGYRATVSLAEGMRRTEAWFRETRLLRA